MKFSIMLIAFVFSFHLAFAQDALLQKTLTLQTNQFDQVLLKTENNIRLFVENFNIKLEKGLKLKSAKLIEGTLLQPVLKMTLKKCVFIVCKTIDFDGEFTLRKTNGACAMNYVLTTDLRRSSAGLSDLYTDINTSLCLQKTATGATAVVTVNLARSLNYRESTEQKETIKIMKLQADSIIESFIKVMLINGVTQVL